MGKLDNGLRKTKGGFFNAIAKAFSNSQIEDDFYEDLLDNLVMADVGYETAQYLTDELESRVKKQKVKTGDEALELMKEIITELLQRDNRMDFSKKPTVVLLAAGDTFRAAAASQLTEWANRAGVDIVKHGEGADPAAVIFEAVEKAKREGYDIVICDTAGRLHNKKNLMAVLS